MRIRIAALVCLLLLPGCGAQTAGHVRGAGAGRSDRTRLETMVVPLQDVGGLPAGLQVAPGSGWIENQTEAKSSFDPSDSAETLSGAGRISGYELAYYDPTRAALRSGHGVLAIMSEVELFSSERAASAYLRDHIEHARRLQGTSPQAGVTFGAVKPFAAGMTVQAYGLHESVAYGMDRVFRTLIAFRRGRIVASVMVIRADTGVAMDIAQRMAGILDSRIQIALHGGSNGGPVVVPAKSVPGQPTAPQRPPGAPDLAAIALGPADLPPGIPCYPGYYSHTSSPRITFRRQFCPRGAAIGQTRLTSLTSEVSVFESEAAASASLVLTARAAAAPGALKTLAANVSATQGLVPTHVRSRQLKLAGGDVAILFTFDTKAGRMVDFYALAQRGRGLTTLDATGAAKGFDRRDLLSLLRVVTRRLDSLR